MARELTFKNLPFVPAEGQVIYVEPSFNKRLNGFIRKNYDWLRTTFRSQGLEFCYLPLLAEEAISYNAPYLTDEDCKAKAKQVPSLADFLDSDTLDGPALVFGHDWQTEDAECHVALQSLPIQKKLLTKKKSVFLRLAEEIRLLSLRQRIEHHDAAQKREGNENKTLFSHAPKDPEERRAEAERAKQIRFSIGPEDPEEKLAEAEQEKPIRFSIGPEDPEEKRTEEENHVRYSIGPEREKAEKDFDSESLRLIDEIKTRIESLRNRGVNTMFLHNIIDEVEPISRLRVTKDFRIYLVDYGNMEIKMPVLPKSVFMLFLRHPEGIRFKELSDYYTELLEIYLKMNPIGGRSKQEQSIRDVTDPCSNSINEKCARIREAFVANFDDRLAKNYYVTGKRGEPKRITLDKTLIVWDN